MVIMLFDAEATVRDSKSYRNTYAWYFQMADGKVIKTIAFFDNRHFDEFWRRSEDLEGSLETLLGRDVSLARWRLTAMICSRL